VDCRVGACGHLFRSLHDVITPGTAQGGTSGDGVPHVRPSQEVPQHRKDWTSSEFRHLYGKEEMPPNMPEPRGLGFIIRAKVDVDHAAGTVTRRSRTGFLVYLNCALVQWFSKKQNYVESSNFGSDFIAMKQCCEYVRGLRYKLRMMGILVLGLSYSFGKHDHTRLDFNEEELEHRVPPGTRGSIKR
jgi:hypothetical protein